MISLWHMQSQTIRLNWYFDMVLETFLGGRQPLLIVNAVKGVAKPPWHR